MIFTQAIQDYIGYLGSYKNYSSDTIRNYKKQLSLFHKYIQVTNNRFDIHIESITKNDFDNFIMQLQKTPPGKTSSRKGATTMSWSHIYSHISAMRQFLKYYIKRGYDVLDPINIEGIKRIETKKTYIPREIIDKLINFPMEYETDIKRGMRNKLFLMMLYGTGSRLSELLSLKVTDIPIVGNHITILGKGGKIRQLYISDNILNFIHQYLEIRQNNCEFLFTSTARQNNGARLSKRAIQQYIEIYRKVLGLSSEITAHSLRRAFASHLVERGVGLRTVQELLGHEYITTTQRYVQVSENSILSAVKLLGV